MPIAPISLPPGIVKGSTPSVTRGRWHDGNLIRWRGQHLQPIGGWSRITDAPLASKIRRIHAWRDLDDIRRVALFGDTKFYVLEGSDYADLTPADFQGDTISTLVGGYGIGPYNNDVYGTPRIGGDPRMFLRANSWSLDNFGEDLLALASSDGRLLCASPGGSIITPSAPGAPRALPPEAEVIPGAPIANRCMVVTEERHVMLGGAGGNPRRVAWCSREDYNDWDFASTTNTAGYIDLEISGWIVHMAKVRGGVLVFTDDEVWIMRYKGVPFVYGVERVGRACSLVAPHAFGLTAGVCAWMGKESFWFFDGGLVRPLPCDVDGFVYNGMDEYSRLVRPHAGSNGLFTEMWFFYPSQGQSECDRVAIWSPLSNGAWWSIGTLPRTAMLEAGVYPLPLMTGPERHVFQHEDGWTDAGVPRVGNVWAETGALTFPQNGERSSHVMSSQIDIGRAPPDLLDVRAYARMTHDGPEEVYGPFIPRSDGYTDMRLQGRDVRLRISNRIDTLFSIGEMRFDIRPGGRR